METTLIEVSKLLEILKENRKNHLLEYAEASQDRINLFHATMKKATKEFKTLGKIPDSLNFPSVPLNESEYNKAIRKLELETRSEIELNDYEFDRFVMDKWEWKNDFLRNATMYKSAL